ncbi:MAG: glycosyltransferase family 4 protein [Candidatus Bathyarchaeia archaeon]|jgi:1,2-diacylglycerol 3-alpha-glucosyltransferase
MATGIYGLAGSSIVIENLAKQLVKKGEDVTIGAVRFKRPPLPGAYQVSTIPIGDLPKLSSFIESFDIIHCHHPVLNYVDLISHVPFIYHYHGVPMSGKANLFRFSMISSVRLTNHRFAAAIAVSHSGYEDLKQHMDAKKIRVIYNGVDTSLFRSECDAPYREGVPQFLFVGNLFEYKKVDELIVALKKLINKYPLAHLQIIGEGESMAKLKHLVYQLNIKNNVSFRGAVPNNDLAPYYASCDVYVTASRCESSPLPLFEAWACGKPVFASSIPAHQELLSASNAGMLYEVGDIDNLCENLSYAYENKDYFKNNALEFAKLYDWSLVADRILAIYKNLTHD